ncbi:MAG: PAS domain-containing sensor histidine kinase [Acidobacteriota bacterium]|nr:MAG: PAS domain-containing sensor histidine kinase [Acidobacteriota bacterium]
MENPFERYFDALPCYLTVQDKDFRIVQGNQKFRRDFGNWEGRYCFQVYKHRSEKCEVCPVERCFWDGNPHRSEETVRSLDGREISVLVEATPLPNRDGEITQVMEMSTDVTLIKRLEDQLRESRRRYQVLFEEVPSYISIQTSDLRITETNRAFREDFGASLGRYCYKAYKHRSEECIPCPIRETFRDGQVRTREEVVSSPQGKPLHVLVTAAPIYDEAGKIASVMEMSANITQIRELETQLTTLGLLIGSISHGLKGLLNGLAGGMYLVNTGFKKGNMDRVHQGWDLVERNVARIRTMVSDILYYAKPRVPNWEPLSAEHMANEVAELLRSRLEDLGIRLDTDFRESGDEFEGDVQAIRSLLVNLLENSADACRIDTGKSDHVIVFRTGGTDTCVEFEIQDNGIGMDRETREKAFSLFFSSKGSEGTGLGLFIANRIAVAHGGVIELSSEVGQGTRFLVRLPRSRKKECPKVEEAPGQGVS